MFNLVSLVVVMFLALQGNFQHYESLLKPNQASAAKVAALCKALSAHLPSWSLPVAAQYKREFTQTNCYDCGVYVWLTMETILRQELKKPPLFKQSASEHDIAGFIGERRQYLAALCRSDSEFKQEELSKVACVSTISE
jgi:hypothetical protein